MRTVSFLCSICCLFIAVPGLAQLCGTIGPDTLHIQSRPWYGNPAYLEHYLDSTQCCAPDQEGRKLHGLGGVTPANVRIPIQFILANDDNGNPPLEFWELEAITRRTNEFHNNAGSGIQFYVRCPIVEFNADSLHTGITSNTTSDLYDLFQSGDAIDVFVIESTGSNWVGIANFPSSAYPFQTIITGDQTTRNLLDISTTLCHEIGHCLDLLHTHHPNQNNKVFNHQCKRCRQESVDRTRGNGIFCNNTGSLKCSVNGDILCDTEADPRLSIVQNVDPINCTYNGPGNTGSIPDEDKWGDQWIPDVRNVMSYAGPCRNSFSPMQSAVQRITALNGIPDVYPALSNDFDVFEPDNTPESAQPLTPGQVQCHTFHFVDGTLEEPVACDEDWYAFSNPSLAAVRIKTWSVLYQPDPDTEINLFDNSFNLIANNDNFGGSSYAWINWINLSAGDYFIQVINNSPIPNPGSRGHYNIGLDLAPPVSRSEPVQLAQAIKIYPNPAQDFLEIYSGVEKPGVMSLEMYSNAGQIVLRDTFEVAPGKVIKLDVGQIPRGLYFIKFEFNGRFLHKKVVLI